MGEQTSTILVIDDEPFIHLTLGALLAGSDYHVEFARHGRLGLEMARQIHPDLILLDVLIPEMDGFEVCERLRADPELAEVPIFMLTALDDRQSRLMGLSVGADDFITKPVDDLELRIRLNVLKGVNRYRHLREERQNLTKTMQELILKNNQLTQLSRQMLAVQETLSRNLALELHDEIGQLITGLKLILEQPAQDNPTQLEQARAVTDDLLKRVRDLTLDLRPTILDDFGLNAALDWYIRRFSEQTGLTIQHNLNPLSDQRVDKIIETTVFRVAQEALTNIGRHAAVREANLTLTIDPGHLQLCVLDSGCGFDPARVQPNNSSGLSGMRERADLAGGVLTLQSTPGEGTFILLDFDLTSRE